MEGVGCGLDVPCVHVVVADVVIVVDVVVLVVVVVVVNLKCLAV